jgi:hypothetical protein
MLEDPKINQVFLPQKHEEKQHEREKGAREKL